MSKPILLVSAAVLLDAEGQVLIASRPPGKKLAGLWEFPGGKVEPGETPEQTVAREFFEELGLTLDQTQLRPLTFASHAYDEFHLMMPLFACSVWSGTPHPKEGQQLAFVKPSEFATYNFVPADIPLLPVIARLLG